MRAIREAMRGCTTQEGRDEARRQAAEEWILLLAPDAPPELRAHPATRGVLDPLASPSPEEIAVAWDALCGMGLVEPGADGRIARDGVYHGGVPAPPWAQRTALLRCFARRSPRWMDGAGTAPPSP